MSDHFEGSSQLFHCYWRISTLTKYSSDKMYREFVAKIMEVKVAEINPPLNQRHGN